MPAERRSRPLPDAFASSSSNPTFSRDRHLVLRIVDGLRGRHWTVSGWFLAPGPLPAEAWSLLSVRRHGHRPIAYSLAGWRRTPGALRRLRQTPGYFLALRRALLEIRPHVVHANSILSLPLHAAGVPLGEDLRARRRHVHEGHGAVSREGVECLFRGIWRFFAVLLLVLAIGFAVGWAVRSAVDTPTEEIVTVER
jgi:hypothetical protein